MRLTQCSHAVLCVVGVEKWAHIAAQKVTRCEQEAIMAHVALAAQAPQFIAAIVEVVSTAYAQFDAKRRQRKAVSSLSALSDRDLHDICHDHAGIVSAALRLR
jgi:uncharacterized protein YjiS (DUF1127 family)